MADLKWTIQPGNAQAQGDRKEQQDAFGFSDLVNRKFCNHGGSLAVLSDGMGGMEEGQAAARLAVDCFLSHYRLKEKKESVKNALWRSVQATWREVANWATQHGLQDQAGATLLATAIIENDLYWVALGDSRIYLVRNSRVFQINVDHVYAAELDRRAEYGEMEIVDAMRDPDRPALTSYLGMNPPPLIDRNIRPFQLQSGDWVFLFSDGLYNGLREDDFKLIDSGDPQSVCETLVDHVLSRKIKNQDNLTVMALAISKSSNPSWFGQFKRIWSK